jgi:hypothetical protein
MLMFGIGFVSGAVCLYVAQKILVYMITGC